MAASRLRRIAVAFGVIAILAVGGTAIYVRTQWPALVIGTGYAARIGCGCRFIARRPLAGCYRDLPPGTGMIRLTDDPAARSVTASVPLLLSRTARRDPVLGCQLPPR